MLFTSHWGVTHLAPQRHALVSLDGAQPVLSYLQLPPRMHLLDVLPPTCFHCGPLLHHAAAHHPEHAAVQLSAQHWALMM